MRPNYFAHQIDRVVFWPFVLLAVFGANPLHHRSARGAAFGPQIGVALAKQPSAPILP